MITTIKKVKPMFNNMVVTLNKYPTDLKTTGGIIDSTRAGSVKEYQTVVAVGPMVRGIEVGDIVYINPKRYAVMQHKPGSLQDGVIKDIRFDGEACAICTASTSIMSELLIGKTIDEANVIIENYNNMIYEKDYDPEILEEAIAFMNTHKQANRIKCATLGWTGIKQILDKEQEETYGRYKK